MESEIDKVFREIDERKLATTGEIKTMKNNILQRMLFDRDELKAYHKLLTNYRYIDEIDELKYGSYIRWFNIKKSSLKLLNGGFIIDITNRNGDIVILCKNGLNRLFNLKMNESIIFQKNTKQEELLIKILDHIKTIE
jgi:hypothetical protein